MRSKNRLSLLRSSGFFGVGLLLLWPPLSWAQTVIATVPVAPFPAAVAVNPVTNKIYVASCRPANFLLRTPAGGVTVIDGQTNTTTTIPGTCPVAVAVNPVTNKVYVADSGSIIVIDGATNSKTTVTDSNNSVLGLSYVPREVVAVNSATNKIYVAHANGNVNASGSVTVLDGATNSTTTIVDPNTSGLGAVAIAINSATNKIYVANRNISGSGINPGNITVIDGATNATTTVTDPNAISPVSVAVNSATDKIYVANMGNYPGTNHGNVTVIDGATNSITTVTDPNALSPAGADSRGFAVAVNSVTNTIYVTNEGSNNVTVIDGATNSITTVTDPNAIAPIAVAVDAVTSMIYVANSGTNLSSLTVINGATNVATTVIDPEGSWDAVALNLMTNRIYVADSGDCVCVGNNVAVIDGGATATSHTLLLGVKGNGSGTVTSSPAGINCTASCTASFAAGTAVSLSASPASGSEFSGWKMACAGTSSCNVTMRSDVVVTATFIAPDFSVRLASEILTAQRGSQVTDAVTIAPLNGTSFGEAIQLSCAVTAVQLPSIATGPIPTCALSPSSVTPGASSATSMLTITAPTSSAGLMPPLGRLSSPLYGVFLPISFALIGFGRAVSKQRRRQLWLRCGLFLGFIAIQAGCGGGSSNQQMQPQNYIVIVTGTSGAIQHTAQVTVTVP